MFFTQDLSSLATQQAPGKGGENCIDGAKGKELRRKRGTQKEERLRAGKSEGETARILTDSEKTAAMPELQIVVCTCCGRRMLLLPGNTPDVSTAAKKHGGNTDRQ